MVLARMSPSLHSPGLLALISATKLMGTPENTSTSKQLKRWGVHIFTGDKTNTDMWWPPSFIRQNQGGGGMTRESPFYPRDRIYNHVWSLQMSGPHNRTEHLTN